MSGSPKPPHDLEDVVNEIMVASEGAEQVSVGDLQKQAGGATNGIAATSAILSLTLPALEIIPFAAAAPGAAITAFGLALVAHDGVLALFGYGAALVALYLVISGLIL